MAKNDTKHNFSFHTYINIKFQIKGWKRYTSTATTHF